MTPVVFRKQSNGEVIALLPTMPVSNTNRHTACVGFTLENGVETVDTSLVRVTDDAKPREYRKVLDKLMEAFPEEEFNTNKRITEAMLAQRAEVKRRALNYLRASNAFIKQAA